jgi:hypothetical protein
MKARHTRPRFRRSGTGLSAAEVEAWYARVDEIRNRKMRRKR